MTEAARSPDQDEARGILERRARALARPLQTDEPDGAAEYVVLLLGSERYGVDIRKVHETQTLESIAAVPGTPPFWAGVVNVRGTLYPVLDLRRYLGLEEDEGGGDVPKKLVLVSGAGLTVGLTVDDAPAVRRVPGSEVGPPLPGGAENARGVVSGMTRDLLAVLDVDALLADPRLALREEAK